MPRNLFDQDAPWTVRAGAICLLLANILDFIESLFTLWSDGAPHPGLWRGVVRPVIGLVAGLGWSWGIAQMLGVFYWFWVVTVSIMVMIFLVMLALSMLGLPSGLAPHALSAPDVLGLALIVASFVLLISRPSLRAYWRHGRLIRRKATASPDHPPQQPAGGRPQ